MSDVTVQALIAAVVTIVLAWKQSRTRQAVDDASHQATKEAETARSQAEQIRKTLAIKQDELGGRLGQIHVLVNDRLGTALRVAAAALRRIADQTGTAEDQSAADYAQKQVEEHDARQTELDLMNSKSPPTSDAIYTKDLDGVVTSWSPACEKLFGWAAAEVLGRPTVDHLIPRDLWYEHMETVARARRGESTTEVTDRMTKDGRRLRVGLTTTPSRDATGAITGVITFARRV